MLQNHFVGLAADAGFFVAAKRRAFRNLVVCIDPHTAGLDAAGDADGAVDVPGPDGAAQAVGVVVGHADDLVLILEFDDTGHGPEDLFLGHAHIVGDVRQQGGAHEAALGQLAVGDSLAATDDPGALLFSDFDIA